MPGTVPCTLDAWFSLALQMKEQRSGKVVSTQQRGTTGGGGVYLVVCEWEELWMGPGCWASCNMHSSSNKDLSPAHRIVPPDTVVVEKPAYNYRSLEPSP